MLLSAICCCQGFYFSSCDKLSLLLSCRTSHRLLGTSLSTLHNISPFKSFQITLSRGTSALSPLLSTSSLSMSTCIHFPSTVNTPISTVSTPVNTYISLIKIIIVNHFNWSCILSQYKQTMITGQ